MADLTDLETADRPKMLWNDNGNSFMCSRCYSVIPRTRFNPYPNHECAARVQLAKEKHDAR